MITRSNLFFCLLPDIFFPYLSPKFPSSMYSRVIAALTFCPYTPLRIFGIFLASHVQGVQKVSLLKWIYFLLLLTWCANMHMYLPDLCTNDNFTAISRRSNIFEHFNKTMINWLISNHVNGSKFINLILIFWKQ